MREHCLPRWLPVLAAAGLLGPGCKDDDEVGDDGAATTTGAETGNDDEIDPDGTDTSEDESTGGEDEVVFEFEAVFGVPNLDDDDQNGTVDWFELPFDADNDVSALHVPGVPEGYRVEMTLLGDLEHVRIWRGTDAFIGHGGDPIVDTFTFDPGPEGVVLDVEFGEYNARAAVEATLLDREGSAVETVVIDLYSSPLIMNHHLQPTEQAWVVELNGNGSMVADLEAVLGDRLTKVPGNTVGFDVWIQDEIELATSLSGEGTRLDTVIDSIRERGLGPYPKNHMQGPDAIARMWGNPNNATTFDSFGNLEASPPVTVDGVEYPFGRIYYGAEGNWGLDQVLAQALDEKSVQRPFQIDTNWLCVAHVDEFSSFIPDPAAPKGFRFLYSDTTIAYQLIDDLEPDTQLPRYAPAPPNGHAYATIGAIVNDAGLRAYNEDLQSMYLDPMLDVFKTELALEDEDIILIPTVFDPACGSLAAALIPGTINLFVANPEGEGTHLFVPDPFFRSDTGDQSTDAVLLDFAERMPDGIETHFVDNWNVYHLNLGEVHCGTNARRTPLVEWFDVAMHLLED